MTAAVLHPPAGDLQISTPDQRVRVFVSSTLVELADDRRVARTAIARLHLTPVMFEVGARAHPAQDLYRAYLAQSDVFVGIYGQRYGWVAPGDAVSGLEDEYLLAGDRPKLIYVKAGSDRESRLQGLLDRIRADDGVSYKKYASADELGELLADDLAVLLTERFSLSKPAMPTQPTGLRVGSLPVPPTPIVGREREIATVCALLADPTVHLVTLLGPGGIGKTRLALEVAGRASSCAPDGPAGVTFVDLSSVREPALWPEAVMTALGIRPEGNRRVLDMLIDRLQGRRLLVVLDNVEQLVGAAAELGALLAACPDVTVLVTSRVVLGLRGEREVALAPLPLPPATRNGAAGPVDVGTVQRSTAVQLLVARARQVRPGFAVTPDNAAAVAELSRRLDGIPLAIEVAAARLRLLTPAALVRRLSDRLDHPLDLVTTSVDTPDRQRTLRATIEWSHSLLGEAERAMFARLSVFTATFTLEGAQAVGTHDGDLEALDTLTSLVAKSLVRTDQSDPDEPRFGMLVTIRDYARERLVERGETDSSYGRLAGYMRSLVDSVEDSLQRPEQRCTAARLDRELDQILATIDWGLQCDDADTVVALLAPLLTYWWSRGPLELVDGKPARARALHLSALDAADAIGNDQLRARFLDMLGLDAVAAGDLDEAWDRHVAASRVPDRLSDHEASTYAVLGLAGLALARHRPEVAAQLLAASGHALEVIGAATWQGFQPPEGVEFAPWEYQAQKTTITAVLGPAYTAARTEGALMTIPEAIGYGLAGTAAKVARPQPGRTRPGLNDPALLHPRH